jgi:hypothetical protein
MLHFLLDTIVNNGLIHTDAARLFGYRLLLAGSAAA